MSDRDQRALSRLLTARVAAALGLAESEVDSGESFSRYGLDSARAVGLTAELARELGRPLSSTLLWAYPNVDALARHLASGDQEPSAGVALPRPATMEPIAIVGMACRMPGADDPETLWHRLCEGYDAIREVPRERFDIDAFYDPDPQAPGTINTRRGAFLDDVDRFDPLFFGISPREAVEMDPQQRMMLELSWEALEDAGLPPRGLAGSRTGVFFGVIWKDYGDLHRDARALVTSHTGAGQALNIVANRVSYALGLQGPSLVLDTACSSSLVAVHLACQSLWSGESTLALAGGINLALAAETMVAITKFGGLAGDGRCRTFDAKANGFVPGEGVGCVLLKPLASALADGDHVYAVIDGSAINNDGHALG
ncbi:MAG TPA: type I polyketide synthase, partial [Thermoanaerobaculia bacterium]